MCTRYTNYKEKKSYLNRNEPWLKKNRILCSGTYIIFQYTAGCICVPIYKRWEVKRWHGIEWKIKTIFFSHNYTAPPNNDDYDDDDYDDDGNWIN